MNGILNKVRLMRSSKQLPMWLMFLACLCLGAVFLFPLWRIRLDAPQFPGGLRLDIWVDKLSGSSKHIIQNINILNHYIGMKFIDEDSIPELTYFPYIIYVLLGIGIVVAVIRRHVPYLIWCMVLTILSALGVYDFYLWLYDYGHNLDPKAPISIPGMTYMPPVLGGKHLLNFYAFSYPWIGTLLLILAIGLSFFSFWISRRKT
jgi:copper chaperone NosL